MKSDLRGKSLQGVQKGRFEHIGKKRKLGSKGPPRMVAGRYPKSETATVAFGTLVTGMRGVKNPKKKKKKRGLSKSREDV